MLEMLNNPTFACTMGVGSVLPECSNIAERRTSDHDICRRQDDLDKLMFLLTMAQGLKGLLVVDQFVNVPAIRTHRILTLLSPSPLFSPADVGHHRVKKAPRSTITKAGIRIFCGGEACA